jgi:hypothetical protein
MMIYEPKTLEEHILNALQKGSFGTIELQEKIRKVRPSTTKQGFYQALRKLKKDEVVIVYAKRVSLSHIWINKMAEYFRIAESMYTSTSTPSEDFLKLADGDKISYTFKNSDLTDQFWGHAFGILNNATTEHEPLYMYDPHEWFFLARHASERVLFDEVLDRGKDIYMIVGGKTPLDKYTSKEFDNKKSFYYMTEEKLFPRNNYYVNIFGDFLIEAWLDQKTQHAIDEFYKTTSEWSPAVEVALKEIIKTRGKNKLTISHNKHKADKIKRIFRKYFFIKKSKSQDARKETTNTLL